MALLERLRGANLCAAVVLGVLDLLVVVTTLLPGAPYVPVGVVMALFVFVFPVFGAALIREVVPSDRQEGLKRSGRFGPRRTDDPGMRRLMAAIPRPVRAAFTAFFFAMWLAAMSSFFDGLAGQPTERDGRYFLNNHGDLTEITSDEYDRAVSSTTRAFAAIPSAFYATAALLCRYGPLVGTAPGDDGPSTQEP